jgi:tetratricopeptide (TPR) repeat protein
VRRLPREERIEVCFQCHLGDSKASERVIRHDRPMGSFRPGERITDSLIPFRFRQPTQYDFGLTAQVDRLLLSRCYTESGGQIECLTCHNPHVTVYREGRPADFFRRPCLSCHTEPDCGESLEVRRQTEPAADDCWQCHMRKAEADDQRFAEYTDHWIRRDIDVEKDHRTDYAYEPIFPERLERMSPGEQAFYRARAGGLMASRTADAGARPLLWETAARSFEEAIDAGFDTVHSQFFLGKAYLALGRLREAEVAFERAVAHDPSHHDAGYALGQALARRGQLPQALEIFRGLLENDPGNAMALAEIGRTLSMMGRREEAIGYFDQALLEEPWSATLHLNKARVFAAMQQFERAARLAEEAVRHDPDNPTFWMIYEKAHEAAGLVEQAAEGRRLREHFSEIERRNRP